MLKTKDFLDIKSLNEKEIFFILETAKNMKNKIDNSNLRNEILKNKTLTTLFYENSTRTKMSFTLAGDYLGMDIADLDIQTSSVNKGESLIDTAVTLDMMGIDVLIIRHFMTGAAHLIAKYTKASVINAGDGTNEHPTQALLDLFTILEYKKDIQGLNISIVGDIANSRVARSNIFLLSKLGANINLVAPSTLIAQNIQDFNKNIKIFNNIKDGIKNADVVMGLRIQNERQKKLPFPSINEYKDLFSIKKEMLNKEALIMHPGPVNRGVEMEIDVIESKNAIINNQVKNGVALRMAIIKILLENR